MFGTFRYNNSLKEAEYVELSRESGVDARGYTLLACTLCRARKLKCSGERGGCSRCLASSAECVYGPEGDGYGNGRRTGRSKGATRRRHRQTVPPKSSTTDDDRPSTTSQHGRTTVGVNGPSRRSRDAEDGDGRRPDINGSSSAPPDSTKTASAHIGHPSDGPPSTDWSGDLFGFDDFTDLNGAESPSFGLSSMNSPVDGTLSNSGFSTTPGPVPSLSQPPNTSARAPSTTSASLSVPEDPSPLTAQDQEICFPRLGLTRPGGGCQCLTTLAGILERLGRYRLGDKPKTDKNLDCLLFCLGTGVDACKKVLSCKVCNACQEHSILLATIAERLPHICNDLCGCLLVHQHKVRAAANTGAPQLPGDPSGGNPQRESEGELTLVDGEISFGRYKIQGAEMHLRLIQNLMALYMTDLLAVLDQLYQRIGQVDGTVGMLDEAREMATTAEWMLQQLRSGS
ncbi:hypothetical protein INS49_000200 [Diaporthe citri]|uniref:uncharacterized protein n=1 Tax=Diaporthe citri TaxID=83186 RepID=UPI001C8237FE|nr:uncharacterized protein INS49_000200 [Diaporthe citri]KAG6366024.1 hypothetical protein INS49_000200 [Diaporthe citri]